MMRPRTAITLAIAGLALLGCGSARRGEPIVGPTPMTTPQLANGEMAFMAHCHQCHPKGEAGLGPAINNKPLPAFLIRLQVREGLGAMPAFSPQEVTPRDLDDMVAYLQLLRESG